MPIVDRELGMKQVSLDEAVSDELDTLIVIGGGSMIDEAKARTRDAELKCQLIAVPSIWGSGAEASPVVVLDAQGNKDIRIDPKYIPDKRVIWPELAASIPPRRAKEACGDCWAHALEGFLSPLADDELRADLANVMREMLTLPLTNDPRWFEPSALACAGQSRSSVGLVHGIAHVIEAPLRSERPTENWHHAMLCAIFLRRVMDLNRAVSDRWNELTSRYELDEQAIFNVLDELIDPQAYATATVHLADNWSTVLRNPCTRTNCVLVRPRHLEHFTKGVVR